METAKTYNGWTNYETWIAGMYFDGNYTGEETYSEVRHMVKRLAHKGPWHVGEYLKEELQGCIPDMGASLAADLLNAAISEINFHELAEHYIQELEEEERSEEE